MPLASYIKSVVLADAAPKYRKRSKPPVAEQQLLAEILARLGASRTASNLNQIAKGLNQGTLVIDAELVTQLIEFHAATVNIAQRPGFRSSVELLHFSSGGDVNLDEMPIALVEKCRDAWSAVSDRQTVIVHGDLNAANIIKTKSGGLAIVDWDESRRDLALFDLGQLSEDDENSRQARLAWEIACCWVLEPEHAQRLAATL